MVRLTVLLPGSWPAPNVIEAAAGTGVRVLSLDDAQIKKTKGPSLLYLLALIKVRLRDYNYISASSRLYHYQHGKFYRLCSYKNLLVAKGKMGAKAAWWN